MTKKGHNDQQEIFMVAKTCPLSFRFHLELAIKGWICVKELGIDFVVKTRAVISERNILPGRD